jgi:hypothetical protein
MLYTMDIINTLFPVVSFFLLFAGKTTRHKNLIVIALWLSLIAIVLQYQTSGGEILGSYFNYYHTSIYTLTIIVLLICLIDVLFSFAKVAVNKSVKYLTAFIAAFSSISVILLLVNLWVNAQFIEDRLPGTPVLQVATFKKLDYCSYSYVFYKVSQHGKMSYLCPNYYGLLPAVGHLKLAPDYVIRQLPLPLQAKFQLNQSNKR